MPARFPLLKEISENGGVVYETEAQHPPRGYEIWPESKWDTDPHALGCKCEILFGPLEKNPQVWIKMGKECVALSGGENKRRRLRMTNIYESKKQESVGLKHLATTHGPFGPNHLPLMLPDHRCTPPHRRTTKCMP